MAQQKSVDVYTTWLAEQLERVALAALDKRAPANLAWATGKVSFAANRRLEPGGQLLRDAESGELKGVHFTYTCHNVAFDGVQRVYEFDSWGLGRAGAGGNRATASGVCGDQRPDFCGGVAVAAKHAEDLADEVDRLLDRPQARRRIVGPIATLIDRKELPLADLQSDEELLKFAADKRTSASIAARAFLAKLRLRDRGRAPRAEPFLVQTWRFAKGPTMIFLSGEVCVDYQIRIKRERGADVWPIAYANATPGYIVSRRMLKIGGYEAGNSQFYYGWLRPLTSEVEELVMESVATVLRSGRLSGKVSPR